MSTSPLLPALPSDADAEKVAREILAYLARRPNACDTLDGILHWWLPRIRLEDATETVERALVLLEQQALIDCVPVPAGAVMYCRRRIGAGTEPA